MGSATIRIRAAVVLWSSGVFLGVAPLVAQGMPLRDLPKPAKEIDDPFSLILTAREYRPGQLLVSDGVEAQVSLVDFARGVRTPLGRKGAGPGEYTIAAGFFRLAGDTLWILDGAGAAARIVAFQPDLKPGTTFRLQLFDQQDTTIVQGSMFGDSRGRLYSTAMKFKIGGTGVVIPDSMDLVWFDPRAGTRTTRTVVARVRTPSTGKQDIQNNGGHIKVSIPFPGLVAADAWAAFPDGRVAIVRGAGYRVEFLLPDGSKPAPTTIAYERYKVTEEDKQAELDAVRKQAVQQMAMMRKLMPANVTLDIAVTPPPSWPAEYPPVALLSVLPAPNGDLWVKRSVPARLQREHWDVIDRSGKLVARWQLPPKTSIVAVGTGGVYTARIDEDDLRYVQRVELPR
ncbi:MAG TPA: hypothetical protein VGP61_11040 [Gemmatimonadales bacterium]|nr:hypothetical protein [Gemmatimonadales bacterium]